MRKALKRTRSSLSSRRAPTVRGRLLDTASPRPIRRHGNNKFAPMDWRLDELPAPSIAHKRKSVPFGHSSLRWLGISHLIAEPEGLSFISRTVTYGRLDRRYS